MLELLKLYLKKHDSLEKKEKDIILDFIRKQIYPPIANHQIITDLPVLDKYK